MKLDEEKCNPEIYRSGVTIMVLAGEKETIQSVVQDASDASGILMDWFFMGGRAVVKFLNENDGDKDKVELALNERLKQPDAAKLQRLWR